MKLVIPLAGFGSRMRPHTWTKPKPLINVSGKPFLAHLLDKFADLDIEELVIVYGWLGDQIQDYVEEHYAHLNPRFFEQKELAGQSHALWQARERLTGDGIVVYVDTFFETDLSVLNAPSAMGSPLSRRSRTRAALASSSSTARDTSPALSKNPRRWTTKKSSSACTGSETWSGWCDA